MTEFIKDAFHAVCENAKETKDWYVSLVVSYPFYGGSEEGGWWGSDRSTIAYEHFQSEDAAIAARKRILVIADELHAESRKEYGEQCLREMDWLEARGLEADYLPEPDGEDEYYVLVSQSIPEDSRGCRHYE